MRINPIVKEALLNHKPVVALESTIISHGMPYPRNVETALEVEKTIADQGVIPATIGIIDGEIVIGMTKEEINEFGLKKGIKKVSRRDLPIVVSQGLWGATTVAATMICAAMAGIEVFVTGGIGGVHRNGENTFDISADLEELANTNVSVVCAGAKAILDLNLTMEYLETKGVPVLSYRSDELAAFYSRSSSIKLENVFQDVKEIAKIIKTKREMKLEGGVLISNPVPSEYEIRAEEINKIIDTAIAESVNQNILGKDVTPFLLKRVSEISGGKSLNANIQLILNNAKVGALIAKELCK